MSSPSAAALLGLRHPQQNLSAGSKAVVGVLSNNKTAWMHSKQHIFRPNTLCGGLLRPRSRKPLQIMSQVQSRPMQMCSKSKVKSCLLYPNDVTAHHDSVNHDRLRVTDKIGQFARSCWMPHKTQDAYSLQKTARLAREAVQTAYLSGKSKVDKRSVIDSILQWQKQGCKQKLAAIATARLAR